MKIRHIKTRLQQRRAAFFVPVPTTDGYKFKHIEVLPRSEEEYPIGRKNKSVDEILNTNIEVVPDPLVAPKLKLVQVARKKDDHIVAHCSEEKANEMIAKAKAQKKASLYIMPKAA